MWLEVLLVTAFCKIGLATEYQSEIVGMNSFSYWSNSTVGSPELFIIDEENELLVLAAKNSLCHISLDLNGTLNVQDTKPVEQKIDHCMTDSNIFQSEDNCQNFPHILLLPETHDSINVSNVEIPVNDTVLVCGSNAYQPNCTYRNRTDLRYIKDYNGELFCPYGRTSTAKAIVTSEGHLVSGSSQNILGNEFGITLSSNPFTGQPLARTINNLFKSPTFIDLYEISDHYYVFMSEPASEATDVTYSRVGRICKNDSGIINNFGDTVFTSFLKARMSCASKENNNEFLYYYDNLMDTVYFEDGSVDGVITGKHLYAVLSSPVNGPDGSVLCVYSFGNGGTDLMGIFSQNYLRQQSANEWVEEPNNNPVTCEKPRTVSDASKYYLMEPTAMQTGSPLVKIDGMVFRRLIVDRINGTNGKTYEVILIAANEEDFIKVLKMTYVSSRAGDKAHISQATKLTTSSSSDEEEQIASMELYKKDSEAFVYLSTDQRIYRVPIANCTVYTDCKSCIESRDPYCAYNKLSKTCVSTLTGYTNSNLYQDIDNGDYSVCPHMPPSNSITPTPSSTAMPSVKATEPTNSDDTPTIITCPPSGVSLLYTTVTRIVTVTQTRAFQSSLVTQRPLPTPSSTSSSSSSRLVSQTNSVREPEGISTKTDDNTHTYTLCGVGGAGLVVGIALGMILFACLRNKDKFIWGKLLSRNRRLNFNEDHDKHISYNNNTYEMQEKTMDIEKNNLGDYEKPLLGRPSTPPLTKNNPATQPGMESPVLSKYTKTGKTHNRSLSSGGQFPLPPLGPPPSFETCTSGHHSPVPESPISKNTRYTYHVEEGVSNSDRQKWGKNMVSKQLSREYPVTASENSGFFHSHSNSLDLGGWKAPR